MSSEFLAQPSDSSRPAARLGLLRKIGPGILMAGAAIGVSHIVQSTRAGATYGMELLWLVLAVNVLKYPFFEAGHRYTVATGESLLHGYRRLGPAFLYAFIALNAFTAVISIAGTCFVTAIVMPEIPGLEGLGPTQMSGALLVLIIALVSLGQYKWLSRIIKVMMVVLFFATVAAFFRSIGTGAEPVAGFVPPELWSAASLPFLIALMGWMPAPIELSVWQSLWIQACEKENSERTDAREARIDFHIGYVMTTLLALMFVALGAWVMYGSGQEYAVSSVGFTQQFVSLYTSKLGAWTAPIISAAAFTTLLSTTITVVDAYPRSLAAAARVAKPSLQGSERTWHLAMMILGCVGGWLIIAYSSQNLTTLIDLITTAAFLTAPVFAYLNLRLVSSRHLPQESRPRAWQQGLSWLGFAYLAGFSLLFFWFRFLS
ncbi:Nramp family divalent metal transporter [Pelagicoccus sp. SDUM812003]|uniref:Nramp family divalent metal transporter n=1 Tax=Pelagicoccus sp. SDUM812003 TaxID=3041267 RepID=UPI00280FF1D9|nr:Nramp family divalent metal transporter [Pelagicoccus sp. SDUM812003]MDQ8201742.1 Nramp family divalent metal transporter [Pelagicoccus sp. SDUM812003]